MRLPRLYKIPITGWIIAFIIITVTLANSTALMFGVQSSKSFCFFYSILFLLAFTSLQFLFKKSRFKITITYIDVLFFAYVGWVSFNKYVLHNIHSLSLKYFELLALLVLYACVRYIKREHSVYLLLAICVSGLIQAVYGNLQLWGYYPSLHGLFKMTGSFFNPGPYAGFLCSILPVAVGLYWMSNHKDRFRLKVSSFKFRYIFDRGNSGTSNLKHETLNLKLGMIRTVSVITIVSILLVLPAARSRAAWLGAIAGVAYLDWHKYCFKSFFKFLINGNTKSPFGAKRSPGYREGDLGAKTRKLVLILISVLIIVAGTCGLYHFKKDSADGRILIWTVTANIIKDNPLLGVGQDMFKAHYMDYQADYFRKRPDSRFGMMADDNQYAFNEPLNIWAENGIVGILLAAGIVFSVFFTPIKNYKFRKLNYKFQVPSSRLSSEQNSTSNQQPETCNLKPATITRAAILAILVFGLFAYPSEILPIKITATVCLAILASTTLPLFNHNSDPFVSFVKKPLLPSWLTPLWLKSLLLMATGLVLVLSLPQIKKLHVAYATWKGAMDLYNYGLYEQSLEDYEKAYPALKHNGEFLINFGKALSIAGKHAKAVTILEQAKSYQCNSVLYTAMGDSYKALKKYNNAEQQYLQAANMTPAKFYPLYLLAKLYDASGQQQKALEMANTIINKEVKVHSTAIEEIRAEMQKILEKYAVKQTHKKDDSGNNHRQKGRDNHYSSRKFMLVTLPAAQTINHVPTSCGAEKQKGGNSMQR